MDEEGTQKLVHGLGAILEGNDQAKEMLQSLLERFNKWFTVKCNYVKAIN